jgi:hypothetical protein
MKKYAYAVLVQNTKDGRQIGPAFANDGQVTQLAWQRVYMLWEVNTFEGILALQGAAVKKLLETSPNFRDGQCAVLNWVRIPGDDQGQE